MEKNIDIIKKKPKNKKNRCQMKGCNKKLDLVPFECQCKLKFCVLHRLPEKHNCLFDFKKFGKNILEKNNPAVITPKIVKL